MIRSFKDKLKVKQEAYEAKQQVLAEQAEQARVKHEWEKFDQEQEVIVKKNSQILIDHADQQHVEYLQWKQDQKLLREQEAMAPKPKHNSGVGMNHMSTWQLTWKSFSQHLDIISLPMSEKIRLYKIAEQQQIQRLNYYANLHSQENSLGSGHDWEDGVLDHTTTIDENVIVYNSLDINSQLIIEPGVIFQLNGILTVNASIINRGTIIVYGQIVFIENITTEDAGIVQVI
jgi:hypothetical protein